MIFYSQLKYKGGIKVNNVFALKSTKEITVTACFIAMTFVATMCINIKLPLMSSGGLVHLGNVPVFVAAVIFGKKTGMYAGAFGMGFFDLVSGWVLWSPFTFIICGIIGWTFGKITEKNFTVFKYVLAVIVALFVKIVGYYIAEIIITGNIIVPVYSIPGNIVQIMTAAIVTLPIVFVIKKYIRLGV